MQKASGLGLGILMFVITAECAVPNAIGFQGRLTDDAGTAIDGVTTITFSLYDQQTGGTEVWTETIDSTVTDGYLSETLGAATGFGLQVAGIAVRSGRGAMGALG